MLLAVGVASAGVLIALPTILQLETPPELMGRVSTSVTALPTAGQLSAPVVGAALAAWQSVGFVFAAAQRRRRHNRLRDEPGGRRRLHLVVREH